MKNEGIIRGITGNETIHKIDYSSSNMFFSGIFFFGSVYFKSLLKWHHLKGPGSSCLCPSDPENDTGDAYNLGKEFSKKTFRDPDDAIHSI